MGQRRARSDDHPVELALFDLLDDVGDGVLGASVEIVLGMGHAGQRLSVSGDAGHVEETADVAATMAGEDADSRLLGRYVPLRRISLDLGEAVPGRG